VGDRPPGAIFSETAYTGLASGFVVKPVPSSMTDPYPVGIQAIANVCKEMGFATGAQGLFTVEGRLVKDLGCNDQIITVTSITCTECDRTPTTVPTPAPTYTPTGTPTKRHTAYPTPTQFPTPAPTAFPTRAPTRAPFKMPSGLKLKIAAEGCKESGGFSRAYKRLVVYCKLEPTKTLQNGYDTGKPLTFSNQHGDSLKVDKVRYWAWGGDTLYFVPVLQNLTVVLETMLPGDKVTVTNFRAWRPSSTPTAYPTAYPTRAPTAFPTTSYFTTFPTGAPTAYPTRTPTAYPTDYPTRTPTSYPTDYPTRTPTAHAHTRTHTECVVWQ
jgi:hypothetical protein